VPKTFFFLTSCVFHEVESASARTFFTQEAYYPPACTRPRQLHALPLCLHPSPLPPYDRRCPKRPSRNRRIRTLLPRVRSPALLHARLRSPYRPAPDPNHCGQRRQMRRGRATPRLRLLITHLSAVSYSSRSTPPLPPLAQPATSRQPCRIHGDGGGQDGGAAAA